MPKERDFLCAAAAQWPFCLTKGVGVRERQPPPHSPIVLWDHAEGRARGSDPEQKGLCLRREVRPPSLFQKGWGMLRGSKESFVEKSQMDGKEHMGSSSQPFRAPVLTPL